MHITELRIENFKKITAVTIRPDGSLVRIEGRNGQGKSSTLDAIWTALGGKAAAPPVPVRKGAERCLIRLKTGEVVIERTFTKDGTMTLKVQRADGSAVPKPQGFLDALVGDLTFDPLRFAEAKAEDQFNMVKALVPGFDFEANAARRKAAYDARTDVNRELKRLKAERDGIILPEDKRPAPVDAAALAEEITRAHAHNASVHERARRREAAEAQAEELREKAEELRRQAREADKKAQELEDKLAAADPLPAEIDTGPLSTRLRDAERINATARLFDRADQLDKEITGTQEKADGLTRSIETIDELKAEAIRSSKMPVKGLTLGEDMVLLDGLPLEQASDAMRLRVSLAVAAALSPGLRIVRVKDGSLLDHASLELVAKFAEEHDLQVWLERVADHVEGDGFFIENGEIVAEPK